MRLITSLSFFFTLASAIWPKPLSYDHGDTVLFIQKDIPFYWHEAVAKIAGSITEQHSNEQPMMQASDYNLDLQEDQILRLRKRYAKPSFEEAGDHTEEEGVSDDDIIHHAIKSTWRTIFKQNPCFSWKLHHRGWTEPSPSPSSVTSVHIIHLTSDSPDASKHTDSVDESYTLNLNPHGIATISAKTSIGIARGLTTFTQLFYAHSSGKHFYTPLAPVRIYDAPKFSHRGLNLDVARNWFPVYDIKRQIDTLAYNKLNVFHLHITDSQSWPLVIPSLPHLAEKGAYAPELVYTPEDFKELQRHAAVQGVQLVTEIDMPGHTSSIWFGYPELVAAFDKEEWWEWAAEPPSGTLKLNSTAVYEFLEKLFDDVLPRVKPYSGYWHTGGDEVNKNAYTLDDTVRSSDPAILQPLMQTFIDFTHDRVRAAGLTPIVWEEMLLEWNLTLGSDVIVQSWRSDDAVKRIVESGHKALVGNYKYWYLDCGKGQWLDFPPSPYPPPSYEDYCGPYHNWRVMYSYDPLASIAPDYRHLVLGGEAHMWAEQTDPVNVDAMVWPRGCAVAEVLWSEEEGRSQEEASPRLGEMRERLVGRGLRADSVGMAWCTMVEGGCQAPEEG